MSAAKKTAAEARREAAQRAAARRVDRDAAPAGQTAVRSKPVRITVDLVPQLHRRLSAWTHQAALDLDAPRLPLAEVMRAFIRLLDDPAVEAKVRQALREHLDEAAQ
ncbi:hypothetical protein [Actinocorallia aurantiaca]|uniref:Centromere-binding protein ParB C-terminal domain-containing protein n=1 Tax=Actinocorallia aurantiaca TaxID=46204 RepID=A0ABN3UW06_9ACTN